MSIEREFLYQVNGFPTEAEQAERCMDEAEPFYCASWNIASVNINPFEYWVNTNDARYIKFMQSVQDFITSPQHDVEVKSIFSQTMFSQLLQEMNYVGIQELDEIKLLWEGDFSIRKAFSGFLLDKELGMKRLLSMPDRITNAVHLADGNTIHRPSIISSYCSQPMSNMDEWWGLWREFIFRTQVAKWNSTESARPVFTMIVPILRSKYPALTEQEQTSVSPDGSWRQIREILYKGLIAEKVQTTCRIISETYGDTEIFFLQETSGALIGQVEQCPVLCEKYFLIIPIEVVGDRNQNSVILLHRESFVEATVQHLTAEVLELLDGDFVAPGDLLAVSVQDFKGRDWFLVSFHGDGNGLSTQPTLRSVARLARSRYPMHTMVMGVDANTFSVAPNPLFHAVESFLPFLQEQGLISLWGTHPDASLRTTCSSRTFLQPQLTKATPVGERSAMRHQNLKDWILCFAHQDIAFCSVNRDNTGRRRYVKDLPLPTLSFPSDHAIISCMLLLPLNPIGRNSSPFTFTRAGSSSSCRELSFYAKSPKSPKRNPPRSSESEVESQLHLFSRASSGGSTGMKELGEESRPSRTLFDYWGINPKALRGDASTKRGDASLKSGTEQGQLLKRWTSQHEKPVEEEIEEMCENFFIRKVCAPANNNLDERNKSLVMGSDQLIWIMFSTRPASMALQKWWAQLILVIVSFAMLLEGVCSCFFVFTASEISGNFFRLDPITWSVVNLTDFQLLSQGCSPAVDALEVNDGYYHVFSFSDSIAIDGWNIKYSSENNTQLGPIHLQSSLDMIEWTEILFPPWMSMNVTRSTNNDSVSLVQESVDLRPPWEWIVKYCVSSIVFCVVIWIAVFLARVGRARKGITLLSGTCILAAFVLGVSTAVAAASNDHPSPQMQVNFLYTSAYILLGFSFFWEQFQIDLLLLEAVMLLAARAREYQIREDDEHLLRSITMAFLVMESLLLVSSVGIIGFRWMTWHWACNDSVALDRSRFDDIWKKVKGADHNSASKLSQLVSGFERGKKGSELVQRHPKQFVRKRPSWFLGAFLTMPVQWIKGFFASHSERPEVTSLEQLFDQSACLDCFLRRKVKSIALLFDGYLNVSDSTSSTPKLRKWKTVCENSSPVKIIWTDLKRPERTLEKLVRCYNGRVSRLLDCCRQRIVFDSVEDIVNCLSSLLEDDEIKVLRIKNGLNDSCDARDNAGYRHVLVNFQIKSKETSRLGVDQHICELQLGLRGMVEYLHTEQHERYLILRNCRSHMSVFAIGWSLLSKFLMFIRILAGSFLPGRRRQARVTPVQETDVESRFVRRRLLSISASMPASASSRLANQNLHRKALKQVLEQSLSTALSSPVTSKYGGMNRDKLIQEAVAGAADGSVWDMSHPFAAALCKPWIPSLVAVVFILACINVCNAIVVYSQYFVESYHFRLTILESRGSLVVGRPGVSGFRVWRGSECPDKIIEGSVREMVANNSITMSFMSPKRVDQWQFVTSAISPENDPIRFVLERSLDIEGSVWSVMSSSSVTWAWNGQLIWGQGRFDTPLERNTVVNFDIRAPLAWRISNITLLLCFLFSIMILWRFIATKRQMKGRLVAATALFTGFLILMSEMIACLVVGQTPLATTAGALSGVLLAFAVVLLYFERYMLRAIGLVGAAMTLLVLHHDIFLLNRSNGEVATNFWTNPGSLEGSILFIVSIVTFVARWRSQTRSRRTIEADKGAYNKCWAEVLTRDAEIGVIPALAEYCKQMSADLPTAVRQRNRPTQAGQTEVPSAPAPPPKKRLHLRKMPKAHTRSMIRRLDGSGGPPVQDLDQLLAQAAGMDLFLREKIKQWALACGGLLPVLAPAGRIFVRWDMIVGDVNLLELVQWAKLKNAKRAIEKLYRSYDCDVSRLMDCCRQSLYFEDIGDLMEGLRTIAADPDVQLMRINNRLRPDYPSESSAGYRDVMINLRIDTIDTRRLFLDTHVCEVQLVLVEFARIKTVDGHARYVQWRNQTGR